MPTHKGKYQGRIKSLVGNPKSQESMKWYISYLKSKQTVRAKIVMPKSDLSELMKNMNIFHIF